MSVRAGQWPVTNRNRNRNRLRVETAQGADVLKIRVLISAPERFLRTWRSGEDRGDHYVGFVRTHHGRLTFTPKDVAERAAATQTKLESIGRTCSSAI